MGATSDNYEIVTSGITYTIASDYVNIISGGGETAHFQYIKIAHEVVPSGGGDSTLVEATNVNPFPVYAWGGTLGVTVGTLTVQGTNLGVTFGTINVAGTDLGVTVGTLTVQGNNLGITGTVSVVGSSANPVPVTVVGGTISASSLVLSGATIDVSGSQIGIGNFPATQGVTVGPITVTSITNSVKVYSDTELPVGITIGKPIDVVGSNLGITVGTLTVQGSGLGVTGTVSVVGTNLGVTVGTLTVQGTNLGVTVGTLTVQGTDLGVTFGTINVAGTNLGVTVGTLTVQGSGLGVTFGTVNVAGTNLGVTVGTLTVQGTDLGVTFGTVNVVGTVEMSNTILNVRMVETDVVRLGLSGSWVRYDHLADSGFYSLATTVVGFTGNPVKMVGVAGGEAVGITVGTLAVTATDLDTRTLYGGTVGSGTVTGEDYVKVQGICGGYPVGITLNFTVPVSVSSFSNLGVYGVSGATALYVQATDFDIRAISSATDSMTVFGGGTASTVSVGLFGFTGATAEALYCENNALNVNIKSAPTIAVSATNLDIRDMNYLTDNITVVGQGANDDTATSTVPTYINALMNDGTLDRVGGTAGAGWCGAALNVHLVNSGITFSINANATFSSALGISQDAFKPLPVHGSTFATTGLWVAGDTANGPVIVKGYNSGVLPVSLSNVDTSTSTLNTSINQVKDNTDFLAAMKKALYDSSVSVGAADYPSSLSLHTLIRDEVAANLESLNGAKLSNSVIGNLNAATQPSIAVSVVATKQQPSFMARSGYVSFTAKNLIEFNGAAGFTCSAGVRIKGSRVSTGASAAPNEFMCVMYEGDIGQYGSTSTSASYHLHHGEELFVDVDNINKISVFYPVLSESSAPNNAGAGFTFSFYAS